MRPSATTGGSPTWLSGNSPEAGNLPALTRRLFAATRAAGLKAELIFADDDSQDGSVELVEELAADYPVRIIVRRPHAYKFKSEHRKAPIPGLVVLNAEGEFVGGVALPSKGAAQRLVELLEPADK